MNLYAESSAVLAWLLDEPTAPSVREALAGAEMVLASDLTLLECDRAIIRLANSRRVREAQAADEKARLSRVAAHWMLLSLSADIIERARRPFPVEPIRTPDALHVATGLVARLTVPDIVFLTLDNRVRACAEQLGFQLVP